MISQINITNKITAVICTCSNTRMLTRRKSGHYFTSWTFFTPCCMLSPMFLTNWSMPGRFSSKRLLASPTPSVQICPSCCVVLWTFLRHIIFTTEYFWSRERSRGESVVWFLCFRHTHFLFFCRKIEKSTQKRWSSARGGGDILRHNGRLLCCSIPGTGVLCICVCLQNKNRRSHLYPVPSNVRSADSSDSVLSPCSGYLPAAEQLFIAKSGAEIRRLEGEGATYSEYILQSLYEL